MTIKLRKYLPSANEISEKSQDGIIKEVEAIKEEIKILEKSYKTHDLDTLKSSLTIAKIRLSTIDNVLAHIGYMIEED